MTSQNRSTSPEDCPALGGLRAGVRQHDPHGDIACHAYSEIGLTLYVAACESLCGASTDALRGPQVLADGAALVGRVPSERDLTDVEQPVLPDGFRFRTADEAGPKAVVQAHLDAWAPSTYTAEGYEGVRQTAAYRGDLVEFEVARLEPVGGAG